MPINKVNADRLYRFFIDDMQNFNVFVRLMTECREFLSDTQYRGLKEKGRSFDKEILKNCIDDWDED